MEPITMGVAVIIASIIGASATLTVSFLNSRKENEKIEKHSKDVIEGMRRNQIIYSIVEKIPETSTAERAIIFAGHNSGGIPRPSSPFWVSALYWHANTDSKQNPLAEYQKLEVDSNYISMLLESERQKYVVLETKSMLPGILRRYYESEGVTHSLIFFLKVVECKFLYLSAAKFTDEAFSEKEITKLLIKINVIQSLLCV